MFPPIFFYLVPEEGLEPSRGRPRLILSQVRLPFRHSGMQKIGKSRCPLLVGNLFPSF